MWTALGFLTGLAFGICVIIPPTFPSVFWKSFEKIAPIATIPSVVLYQSWEKMMPLPDGQSPSLFRIIAANVLQWAITGFFVGAAAHLSIRRRTQPAGCTERRDGISVEHQTPLARRR
jgi:hypothetical protein